MTTGSQHQETPAGSRRVLVFAPACYSLAETTRMLEIAKAVAADEAASRAFEVRFMSEGGRFEHLVEDEGFPVERIEPRLTPEKVDHILAVNDQEKVGTIYSAEEILDKVRGDVAFLSSVDPVAVVTGSYVSVPLSCRVLGIPLVWAIQSTWLEEFFGSGAGLTENLRLLRRPVNAALFLTIRCWMWFGFVRPVNRAARRLGVRPFRPVLSYFSGDTVLVAEPEELTHIPVAPNDHYVGPLLARQNFPVPDQVREVPRDLPLVYFAMGSSGVPEIVRNILEGFRGQPYRVIAPVRGLLADGPPVDVPANVIVTDWLPALEINTMADIAVIHGGIGTVLTAATAGRPVVGVGMQPEQVANIASLVRKGFAIRVPKSRDPSGRILDAIDTLLHDPAAAEQAREFARIMRRWDGPTNAARRLLDRYGPARQDSPAQFDDPAR